MKTRTQAEWAKRVLGDARYAEHHRFPKWNIEPTVLREPRLFKRVFPELTKADHLALSKKFAARAKIISAQYIKNVNKSLKVFGDQGPLISGSVREHFPEATKEMLRRLAHGKTMLWDAADAHWKASGKRTSMGRDPAREKYQLPRHTTRPHRMGTGIIGRTTAEELHLTSAAEWKRAAEQIMAAVRAVYPTLKRLPAAAKEDVKRAKEFFRRAKLHEKRGTSKTTARASRRQLEAELWKTWPKEWKLTGGSRAIRMKTMSGYADAKLSSLSDDELLHLLHPAHRSPAGRPPARKRVNSLQSVPRAGRRSFKKPSRDPARPFRGAKVVSINIVVHQKGDDQWWTANAFNNKQSVVYSATRTTPSRAFLAVANGTGYGPDAFEKVTGNYYRLKAGVERDPRKPPKPKFKLGDLVEDKDGGRHGKVSFVGTYDEFLGGYRYKVLEPSGTRLNWNETAMVKIKRGSKRDPAATGAVRCGFLLRRITKVAEESVRSKRIGTPQAILDSKGDWELVENLKKTAHKAGCSALQISEAVEDGVQFGRKAKLGETFWKKSSRRDPAFKHCPVGTEVQSLILDQSHFDTRDAMGWAKRHGFRVSKIDTTEHSYRFRQKEPSIFVPDSFRTISMRPGVKAVIGCPK